MATIQEQLQLETDSMLRGELAYISSFRKAEERGMLHTTRPGAQLLRALVLPVADHITLKREAAKKAAAFGGSTYRYFEGVPSEVLAYIAVKHCLNAMYGVQAVAHIIRGMGTAVDDEIRFSALRESSPGYYNTLMNDVSRRTTSHQQIRAVLANAMRKVNVEHKSMSDVHRAAVGHILLSSVLAATDLFDLRKTKMTSSSKWDSYVLSPTNRAIEWMNGANAHFMSLSTRYKPMILKPDDWRGPTDGGYMSIELRDRTPLFKDGGQDGVSSAVLGAVNAAQNTAWRVNTSVLRVMLTMWNRGGAPGLPDKNPATLPEKFHTDAKKEDMDERTLEEFSAWKAEMREAYGNEVRRASKAFSVSSVLAMASEFSKYPSLYFVYQADFRGRLYACSSGLSPQGSDFNKALLEFAEGKPLGYTGERWLCIHGANCYGIDKVCYTERIKWVKDNEQNIVNTAEDPYLTEDWWSAADEPWLFLAFCYEYAAMVKCKDREDFVSHLPISVDGTCNGLQNLSALLRDEVGAVSTNLFPSNDPQDIYKNVADMFATMVEADAPGPVRDKVLSFIREYGAPRRLAKRPVMTLPYGATVQAFIDFVSEAYDEIAPGFFGKDKHAASKYTAKMLKQAIEQTVVKSVEFMGWLQDSVRTMLKTSKSAGPVVWSSPSGVVVQQHRVKYEIKRIRVAGEPRAVCLRVDTAKQDVRRQVNAIVPNLIHSLDAAHMHLTIARAAVEGLTGFLLVHDSYGTHACDVDTLQRIIREEFVRMYKNYDIIQELQMSFKLSHPRAALTQPPSIGSFDITQVIKSEYMFS